MNLIEFTNYLINSLKYMITTFVEVLKLINPANIDKVFKNMKVGTPGTVSLYLIIITVPLSQGILLSLLIPDTPLLLRELVKGGSQILPGRAGRPHVYGLCHVPV